MYLTPTIPSTKMPRTQTAWKRKYQTRMARPGLVTTFLRPSRRSLARLSEAAARASSSAASRAAEAGDSEDSDTEEAVAGRLIRSMNRITWA